MSNFRLSSPTMIAHTTLSISDYPRSKAFYSDVLSALAYRNNLEYGQAAGFNDGKNTDFWISKQPTIIPTHVAFQANSRGQVEAFYRKALAAGATDNGGPGYRDYSPGYFAAFVRDPDGNNIEAVWYDESKAR